MLLPVGILAVLAHGRRLDPVPAALGADHQLAGTGRAVARGRRAELDAGDRHLDRDRRSSASRASPSPGPSTPSGGSRSPPRRSGGGCSRTSSTSTGSTTGSSTGRPPGSPPCLRREFEEPVVLQTGPDLGDTDARHRKPRTPDPDRPAPHLCPVPRRRRGRRRPRLPDRQVNATSLTSILIWLPIARRDPHLAAAAFPLRDRAAWRCSSRSPRSASGSSRRHASTSRRSGLQMEERANWFGDLGVSYHVGVYGFSLWLVGLTVVGMAACTCYGYWVGRDRSRAYFGLMLLPHRRDGRRVRVAGPAPLLRLLRGDADPALHPDRRLGRRAAGWRRRSSSSSTRWPARC